MDATTGAASVWWGIGIAVLFLAVIPILFRLLNNVRHDIAKIGALADDILIHGGALTRNLDQIPELEDTRDLVQATTEEFGTYVGLVDRILTAPKEIRL